MIEELKRCEIVFISGGSWCGLACEIRSALLDTVGVMSAGTTFLVALTNDERERMLQKTVWCGIATLGLESITRLASWLMSDTKS